ncbi:hypothetical protein PLESTB_000733800 [Pleodorina starrii]|uniref:Cytochrome P450 n=1 Tax=Pleodorina starrii TaxID=330485 RepID=A0A9W6F2G2_9CHLO|nr:hypothetical protein PLESTB_000733800 [Pleodorina starrii]
MADLAAVFAEAAAESMCVPLSATTAPSSSAHSSSTSWPSLLGYALLAAVLLELFVILLEPFQRWRLRHIPGPPALPLVGCLPQILRMGSPKFFRTCYQKYGPVYKVGFKFRNHIIVEPSLMRGHFRRMDQSGLFLARDDYWRLVRSAWQPAFSAASLSGYLPRMVACAVQLTDRLETRAREAEAEVVKGSGGKAAAAAGGVRVDILRELASMTLQVVGSTAYGIDFLAMEEPPAGEDKQQLGTAAAAAENAGYKAGKKAGRRDGGSAYQVTAATSDYGRELMRACSDIFRYTTAYGGSRYARFAMLFPELRVPLSRMAHAAPDEPFRKLLAARIRLRGICHDLIRDWEAKHPQQHPQQQQYHHQQQALKQQSTNGAKTLSMDGGDHSESHQRLAAAAEPAAPPPSAAVAAGIAGAVKAADGVAAAAKVPGGATAASGSRSATAVEPGSFLGLILAARDKTTGQALDDDAVAAQAQLFILAGYETTANALTFSVFYIATHPEVERRLLAEIDEVLGPDRPPTEADLPRLPYTEAVFNEAMRLYPPAPATTRLLGAERGEVGGFTVPAGTPLLLSIYTTHHDPRVWPRAEEFIPERFMPTSSLYPEVCSRVPNAHAPFGYGSRMCIGWKFAVQEAKVALARLYQRLVFELEPGQVPLVISTAFVLTPRDGLWVRPVRRHLPQLSQ